MSDLTILIPAAGASSRMRGTDKLLVEIDGIPLLRRSAQIALAAHPQVLVTLRPEDDQRRTALNGLTVRTLMVPDAATGMSASLRAAAAMIAHGACLVLPADMPDLTPADLSRMVRAAAADPSALLRATSADGTPGHPVIFPADLLPALATLHGDEGARSVLQAHKARVRLIALPGQNALTDLDTPEAWEAWRHSRSGPT